MNVEEVEERGTYGGGQGLVEEMEKGVALALDMVVSFLCVENVGEIVR